MDAVIGWLKVHILSWITPPKPIEVIDIIQVILIAYFVYQLILWVKNTRAFALLKGILFIIGFVVIANLLGMEVIVWLVGNLGVAIITAIIIIFQPELRRVLEQMGHKSLLAVFFSNGARSNKEEKRFSDQTLNEIVRACYEMAEVKTGALIVIEQDYRLTEYEGTGIPVDALVSSQLLINIFEHNTPLHDGAVLVRGDRITSATCYLPLSENTLLSKKLGTRHRAAVGISEVSDALTIIVSEETGHVSLAQDGEIETAVSSAVLRERLHEAQRMIRVPARRKKKREGRYV